MKIQWLGHASFKLSGSKIIYIDPWKLESYEKADIILVTHPHFDHLSPKDISKIQKPDTVVIGPIDSLHGIKGEIKTLEPLKSMDIDGVFIEAHRAYNTNKTFHPKVNKWLSYLVKMDGVSVLHTGDSDVNDDLAQIKADIILVPVSGHYVMTADEAAGMISKMKPKASRP